MNFIIQWWLLRHRQSPGQGFMRCHWHWQQLAIHWQQLRRAAAAFICDRPVHELQEDPLLLLAVAPLVDLCLDEVKVAGDEIPNRVVLPRHHIVFFTQLQWGAVVAFPVTKIDESLLSLRCSDSFYDLTLKLEQGQRINRGLELKERAPLDLISFCFANLAVVSLRIQIQFEDHWLPFFWLMLEQNEITKFLFRPKFHENDF